MRGEDIAKNTGKCQRIAKILYLRGNHDRRM